MKWIKASDITTWVNQKSRHCQDTLPELIRRLILAHAANTVDEFDFPSGDSITMAGWDGRLKTSIVSPFFPTGTSGWEISTQASARTKAEEDYKKRTANPQEIVVADSTFVFVTPRSWPERVKWRNEKLQTKKWKDVRVVSADALEQWLDSTPAVAIWLAHQIGKLPVGGYRDLEAFWEEWASATRPAMTPNLVISGRTKDVEAVQKWIDGSPAILEVLGDHPDETIAFLYSAIASMPQIKKTQSLGRCILVENINEMRQLIQTFQESPLIIVAPGACVDAAPHAVTKGHHVFIAMDATVISLQSIMRLARPQRGIIQKILRKEGMSESDALRFARDSGHSISVVHRRLLLSHTARSPSWANPDSAKILLPVLFVGAWSEAREGDHKIIETLSGKKHDTFISDLNPFLTMSDSPILKVGSIWMIRSALDAWFLLATHITQSELKLFEKSILSVLTETDPKYSLSAEKRWAASVYGKSSPYSEWLRTGIVESLALLSVHGSHTSSISSLPEFATHVVNQIFSTAKKWETLASISDETPLLAEAAPDAFMEAVERVIKETPEVFQQLMEGDAGIFDECKHSGLLWALESIAWSPEYFARSVNILGDLASIDKGGKWDNRAVNSLRDIFRPGYPQTHANPELRLAAFDALLTKYPEMVWDFSQSYFRGNGFTASHRFRWRETGGTRGGLEPEDNESHREYVTGFLPKIESLACEKENIISATGAFASLPDHLQTKILEKLDITDVAAFSGEQTDKLLSELREASNWISSFGKEEIRKHLTKLEIIRKKYEPKDPLKKLGWLLSTPWPVLPEGEKDYDARSTAVQDAQEKAAREILDKTSLNKILEFAKNISYPGVLGQALGKVVKNKKEDNEIFDAMVKQLSDMPILLQGYSDGRIRMVGRSWITDQIKRMKTKGNYSPDASALLYLGLPEDRVTWTEVANQGKEVEAAYWQRARGYSTNRAEDASIATEKLLDAKRPDQALEVAGDNKLSLPSSLLQRLIEEFLSMSDKKRRRGSMDQYHLGNVFQQLYQKNELSLEEMAKLEWPFAKLFDGIRRETSLPLAVHRLLQTDPLFFAELVRFMFKRDDRKPDPMMTGLSDEVIENRAQGAQEVLHSWHLLPGIADDGNVDEKKLKDWIEKARKACAEANRIITGDLQIGYLLARAPMGADGAWPHEAVRNVIEQLGNDTIERHIRMGLFNDRGVVTRGVNDGGIQERELSKKYMDMSALVHTKWPRTASILRSMAKTYDIEAKREDVDTDLRSIRWD